MTAISSLDEILLKMATKGFFLPHQSVSAPTMTTAAAASGFMNAYPMFAGIQSSVPGTLVSSPMPPTPDAPMLLTGFRGYVNASRPWMVGLWYRIGDLNLAATGDQFTHHSATFPLLRTKMGEASKPVNLIPFLVLSVATATTAPQFTIKNGGASTGYVDQDGNTVVGTKVFTFPAAASVINSGFLMALEDTDRAIRDIQQINVGVAGSVGTAQIWGFEPLAPLYNTAVGVLASSVDMLGESLTLLDTRPAVATSGTASSFFGMMLIGTIANSTAIYQMISGFKNS